MSSTRLPRVLRPIDGITIVVSGIIGAGIFATPQRIAQHFGDVGTMLALWLACGAFMVVGGMVIAELGTRLPRSGGSYIYVTHAFGPRLGFLEGWRSFMISNPSSRAALAVVTAEYIGYFVGLDPGERTYVAAGVLVAGGLLNYCGMRWSLGYQHLSVLAKAGGLSVLAALGLVLLPAASTAPADPVPVDPSSSTLAHGLAGAMLIYYSYKGYARLGYVGAEVRDPQRTFPVAIFAGLAIVTATYLALNVFYVRTLGLEGMRESPAVAADAARVVLGPIGAALVAAIAIVSASGTVVTTMMASARAYYAMARDRLFFGFFDFVHPRFRTPSRAVVVHLIACLVILFVKRTFVELATSFVFMSMLFTLLRVAALFKLRARGVGDARAYRLPLHPLLPLLYMAGLATLVVFRVVDDWERATFDLAVLAIGIPAGEIWIRIQRRRGESIGAYAQRGD